MSNAKILVDTKIQGKKVVVFSKTYCGYCMSTKDLLKQYNLSGDEYEVIELDRDPHSSNMNAIQDYLLKLTGGRSVPRVFVNGNSIGGCDDTKKAHSSGQLKKMIRG